MNQDQEKAIEDLKEEIRDILENGKDNNPIDTRIRLAKDLIELDRGEDQ